MTIFEEIKELVDVPTAARQYGVEVRRNNFALCPFHNEKTPSCKLYADHYHCYGCGAHGDVIQLVQGLFNLTPMDAVKQLDQDFGLGLDVSRPANPADLERIQRKHAERVAYIEWELHAFQVLHDYLWTVRDWYEKRAPKFPDEQPDAVFLYALSHKSFAESVADDFILCNEDERISMKEVVENIERELAEVRSLDAESRNGTGGTE